MNNLEEFLDLSPSGKVVHCRKEQYEIYIGRPSKWGNPFEIDKDGSREEVIEKYIEWFNQNTSLQKDITELKGKVLGCWCKPKACHGDFLCEIANK